MEGGRSWQPIHAGVDSASPYVRMVYLRTELSAGSLRPHGERDMTMIDFDLLFSRLRGLTWSHVAMAAASFFFATALFVSPAWGYADFARLQQLVSWFGVVAGALSLIAAFASRAIWALRFVEPAAGAALLLGGLWTLNFPFAVDAFVPVISFLGIFLALYLLAVTAEMGRRGVGRPGCQLAVAVSVIAASLANLFGLMGADGMLALSALEMYLSAWGFVYATVVLSAPVPRAELA